MLDTEFLVFKSKALVVVVFFFFLKGYSKLKVFSKGP